MLKMPSTSRAYHELGSTLVPRSNAVVPMPGRMVLSCRSRRPYPVTPDAITISPMPVNVKKRVRLIFTARRYIPTHNAAASVSPAAAPTSGPTDSPAPRVVVQTNREVSRPSRATARNAVRTRIPGPSVNAAVTFPLISPDSARADRRIQKIIMVTNPTAIRLRMPLNPSCALVDIEAAAKVRTAPKLTESAAAASTPVQTWGRRSRWSARTSVATRIETIRPASRPSRSPMSRFGTTSLHTSGTSVIASISLGKVSEV